MDFRIKFQKDALAEYDRKKPIISYSDWEKEFIESIRGLINREVKLSHKQYSILQDISRKEKQ